MDDVWLEIKDGPNGIKWYAVIQGDLPKSAVDRYGKKYIPLSKEWLGVSLNEIQRHFSVDVNVQKSVQAEGIEKIKKLKALAERPGTIDKGIAAKRKIAELMKIYKITEEQIALCL